MVSTNPSAKQYPPSTCSVITSSDVRDSYERCSGNALGKGAYGTVYKGRDKTNPNRVVALKEIRIQISEEGMPMNALREIGLLKQLDKCNHPNVVRLFDVCPGPRSHHEMKLILVFEHIDQDLGQFLERCPPPGLGPDMIKILSGVDFIHTHRIVHRDLKPQNILISRSGQQVKLADFGLARIYGHEMALTSVVVTLYYRAPEVLLQDQYSLPLDLWSCGCIFAELHTRRPLFRGSSEQDQLCKIFDCIGLPSEDEWPEGVCLPWSSFRPMPRQRIETFVPDLDEDSISLIQGLLTFSPASRLRASDALAHPYFSDVLSTRASNTITTDTHREAAATLASMQSVENLGFGSMEVRGISAASSTGDCFSGIHPLVTPGSGNGDVLDNGVLDYECTESLDGSYEVVG